jgi:PAS domain S-box-containing protein
MTSKTSVERNVPNQLEELKESERKYRSLFESMTEGFALGEVILGEKGEPYDFRFLEVNKAWETMTHISRNKATGKTYLELFPQPIADFIQKHGRVALTGEATSFEFYSPNLNLWFSFYVYSPSKGKFASISTDITRRKQTEEALVKAKDNLKVKVKEHTTKLAESEEKYRLLVDNASEVIMVAQNGIIKFMNQQGIKPTGYSLEEMTDKPFLHFIYPADRKAVEKEVRRYVEDQPVTSNYEFRFVTKDGVVRWAIMNAVNISWEGKPAILAIITDITDRKLAEEKITRLLGLQTLLIEICARFISVPVESLDQEIVAAQRRLCEYLDLDVSSSYLPSPETAPSLKLTYLYRRLEKPPLPEVLKAQDYFPWCEKQLVSGQVVVVPNTQELPTEAARDRASWKHFGIRSSLMFPLSAGDKVIGTLSFDTVRKAYYWPEELVGGLKLIAQVFANAIVRKQTEMALRESEAKASAMIKYAPTVIYEADIRGTHFISVNDSMCNITGYSREELLTMRPIELLDEDSRNRFADLVQRTLSGEKVEETADFRARKKDGTFMDVILQLTFSQTEPDKVFVIGHDVTERKKMEEALKESEARANALIKYAPTGIYQLDIRGPRILSVNDAMSVVSGYTREELLAMDPNQLLDESSRKLFAERMKRMLNGEKVEERVDYKARRKDGSLIDVTLQISFSKQDPHILLIIAHDITERKLAEEAVKSSEEKYRSVVENASEAIVISQDGMIKYFNSRLLKLGSYSAEEIKSRPFLDFIHPEDRNMVADRYRRRIKGDSIPLSYEFRMVLEDGSIRWMHMNVALISWEGRPATLGIFTDITEEKHLRDQLIKYTHRVTEAQEEERKRIAYELHDDTAQYLSILKMQLGSLSQSESIQDPKVKEKLQYLEKDADRAFHDVRRFSHELRPVVLERSGLLAALEQLVEDYNKLGQLMVKMKVGGEEPELAEEVKLGFFRITQEALNNTRKHAKATQANIILTFRENQLELSVSDNGTGFDVKEATTRAGGKGSLGLMSMRERADLIGANLKIESKPGQGTIIKVDMALDI